MYKFSSDLFNNDLFFIFRQLERYIQDYVSQVPGAALMSSIVSIYQYYLLYQHK